MRKICNAIKRQMIINLLAPYGDEDEVTDQFRQEIYDLFDSEEVWGVGDER